MHSMYTRIPLAWQQFGAQKIYKYEIDGAILELVLQLSLTWTSS
jgi:hypothetical protein